MPKKTLMLVLAVGMAAIVVPVEVNAELIISQMYEGTASHGKVVELYNTGTESIDLSQYKSTIYFNDNRSLWQSGSGEPGFSWNLSGSLAPGAVTLLRNGQWFNDADATPTYITAGNSTAHPPVDFTGDDSWVVWRVRDAAGDPLAVEEMTDGVTFIGHPWTMDGEKYVSNKSVVRNPDVVTGYNGVPAMEWFDLGEWTVYSTDDVINASPGDTEYLGSHVVLGVLGDFDGDGDVDDVDVDALLDEIVTPTGDLSFDLTDDSAVTSADADEWVKVIKGTEYGDITLDGSIDGADLSLMAANWLGNGQGWATGDLTGEGTVDGADLSLMAANWLFGTDGPAAVPEPATLSLLAIAGLGLLKRRSRK